MFSNKKIKVEITLYDYVPDENGEYVVNFANGKTLVFDDYRVECQIVKVPSVCGYTASLDIYGVSAYSLNQITSIAWIDGSIKPRGVRIYADDGNGYVLLFEGGIMEALPNYKNVPDVSIHIESSMLVYPNMKSIPPRTLNGNTSIYDMAKQLCADYNIACFPDERLKSYTGIAKTYDQDGLGDRIDAFCVNNNVVDYNFRNGGVAFYIKNETRKPFRITSDNYVGYPTFTKFGISLMLDSLMDINCGDNVVIEKSEIPTVLAIWCVNKIQYKLESRKPDGVWNVMLEMTRYVDESEL